jgi:hypothetical protein
MEWELMVGHSISPNDPTEYKSYCLELPEADENDTLQAFALLWEKALSEVPVRRGAEALTLLFEVCAEAGTLVASYRSETDELVGGTQYTVASAYLQEQYESLPNPRRDKNGFQLAYSKIPNTYWDLLKTAASSGTVRAQLDKVRKSDRLTILGTTDDDPDVRVDLFDESDA